MCRALYLGPRFATILLPLAVLAGCSVPDPRPGDLRIDPDADLLPTDYQAPPAPRMMANIVYGPAEAQRPADPAQTLDLYLPAAGPAPVLVWIHSGGWIAGDKAPLPPLVLRQVSRAGYAVASINYRLAAYTADGTATNSFPAAVLDVKTAVRWLKANAAALGLRADKIVVVGGSAGGHLATFAAASAAAGLVEPTPPGNVGAQSSIVAGVVDLVGPSDLVALSNDSAFGALLASAFMGCTQPTAETPRTCDDATLARGNVAPLVTPAVPPVYFAYGSSDTLVVPLDQGGTLGAAWSNAKGSTSAVWFDLVDVDAQGTPLANTGHNISHDGINMRAYEGFLDGVIQDALK